MRQTTENKKRTLQRRLLASGLGGAGRHELLRSVQDRPYLYDPPAKTLALRGCDAD